VLKLLNCLLNSKKSRAPQIDKLAGTAFCALPARLRYLLRTVGYSYIPQYLTYT